MTVTAPANPNSPESIHEQLKLCRETIAQQDKPTREYLSAAYRVQPTVTE